MAEKIISVSLPSSALYVYGTVNDVEYPWVNTEGDTWSATVARSEDDSYRVALTCINAQGTSTDFAFTLYYGMLNLITDRTQPDVAKVARLREKGWAAMTQEERQEYLTALKGAYNADDLNRVESAVSYVAQLLGTLPDELKAYAAQRVVEWGRGFDVPYNETEFETMATKINWLETDIPTPAELARYLGNVVLIRGAFDGDYPTLPASMNGLTHTGANAIERVLELVYADYQIFQDYILDLIDKTAAAFLFCGEIYGGEV